MKDNRSKKLLNDAFDALASNHRRSIVFSLSFCPATITELASRETLTLPAIHKHIKILERAKLVSRKKVGRSNFLALRREALREIRNWIDQFHIHWGSDRETLENYAAGFKKIKS